MGCGASGGKPKDLSASKSSASSSSEQPLIDTSGVTSWATKTAKVSRDGPGSSGTLSTGASPRQQESTGQGGLVMQDADDEDEIEIIQEIGGRVHRPDLSPGVRGNNVDGSSIASTHGHAFGNGQEAPTRDPPGVAAAGQDNRQPAQPAVLSKQQMEEAAKLEKTRQRFDNQRYQREITQGIGGDAPIAFCGPGNNASYAAYVQALGQSPPPQDVVRPGCPTPPMESPIIGLSLNGGGQIDRRDSGRGCPSPFCVPGAMYDEEELGLMAQVQTKKRPQPDFDEDDEALMREILEEHDGDVIVA